MSETAKTKNFGVGGNVSKDGITFSLSWKEVGKLKWFDFKNVTLTLNAKPTKSSKMTAPKSGTSGSMGANSNGGKVGGSRDQSANGNGGFSPDSIDNAATVAASLKHKFNKTPVFIVGALSTDMKGGSAAFSVGGEWKHHTFNVQFTFLSVSGGDHETPVDAKFMTATPSYSFKDIWVDPAGGPNWQYSVTVQIDVGPNKEALIKEIAKRAAARGVTKAAGAPLVLIEGGYLTLEVLYKNIVASKQLPKIQETFIRLAQEAGRSFVRGAVNGSYSGLGGASGARWFSNALDKVRTEHPEITMDELRGLLRAHRSWQENAQSIIANQVLIFLFRKFAQSPPSWANSATVTLLKRTMFGVGARVPGVPSKINVPVPKIVDKSKVKLPDDHYKGKAVPGPVRSEVKHRVRHHQMQGVIPYGGRKFHFKYNRNTKSIEVHGGEMGSVVPFP